MTEPAESVPGAALDQTRSVEPAQRLWDDWERGGRPDVRDFLARAGELKPAQVLAVVRADQCKRWQNGERVPVETYLQGEPPLVSGEEAALDLIYGEVLLREERGERPNLDEYLRRFPRFEAPLRRQFGLHEALGDTAQTRTGAGAPGRGSGPAFIGKYRVISALDAGGQAAVYRAVHPTLGIDVAIKLGHPLPRDGTADRDRLLAEGRILAGLEQPNLARVYDIDFFEDRPFLVMEYVRGRNLDQYAKQSPPPPARAAALVAQVARALGAAHERGVTHQDVKPKNILIDEAGRPRVIDFGLALRRDAWGQDRTEPGSVVGSVQYMAPEQARGETDQVGPRTDVFALGGVLYFLLTGRPPFAGRGLSDTLAQARQCEWDRAALEARGIPPELRAVCTRALSADPADRYARAEELAADLEAYLAKPRRRKLLAAGAAAALVVAAVAVGAWRGWWQAPARPGSRSVATSPAGPGAVPGGHEAAPLLEVRVSRKKHVYELSPDTVPLRAGDALQMKVDVPAGVHATLFLVTSEGRLRRLQSIGPADSERVLQYPQGTGKFAPLTGPPGTEFLFVCGSRSGPVDEEEVRRLWAGGDWPALPEGSLLRLEPGRVEVEASGRDLGDPVDRADPEADVRKRIDGLRVRLRERADYVAGVAFAHR